MTKEKTITEEQLKKYMEDYPNLKIYKIYSDMTTSEKLIYKNNYLQYGS
jgi:hypothetical protein